MTAKDAYDYITAQMSPEKALLTLLEGAVLQYERLKFNSQQEAVHPLLIISMAALDLNWQLAIPQGKDDEEITGLITGTEEYVKNALNHAK